MNRVGTDFSDFNDFTMALYNNTATIINNSAYTLELDTDESSGLGSGIWPTAIKNDGKPVQVTQSGNVNMNFSAAYKITAAGTASAWIVFHYYNAAFIGYSWSMSLLPAGDGSITGVGGSITTSYDGVNHATDQSPLRLSGGGFGGSCGSSETFVVDNISVMI